MLLQFCRPTPTNNVFSIAWKNHVPHFPTMETDGNLKHHRIIESSATKAIGWTADEQLGVLKGAMICDDLSLVVYVS